MVRRCFVGDSRWNSIGICLLIRWGVFVYLKYFCSLIVMIGCVVLLLGLG